MGWFEAMDKVANLAGATTQGRATFKRKVNAAKPKAIKAKAVNAIKNKVTGGRCPCRGVKRGQVCGACGAKHIQLDR